MSNNMGHLAALRTEVAAAVALLEQYERAAPNVVMTDVDARVLHARELLQKALADCRLIFPEVPHAGG